MTGILQDSTFVFKSKEENEKTEKELNILPERKGAERGQARMHKS